MNILDTFYILFETDAKKAEREQEDLRKEAAKTADELDRSVDNAKKLPPALAEAERNAGRLGKSFQIAATAFAAVGAAIGGGLLAAGNARIGEIDALDKTSERLRVNITDLDAWRRTVKAAGGELEQADETLARYADQISKINAGVGGPAKDAFNALGLAATDANGDLTDARTGLLDLASALEGLTRQQQLAKIRALGITDEATVKLLVQGRAAIEAQTEAQRASGLVTREQADAVKGYKDAMDGAKDAIGRYVGGLITQVLPAMTAFIETLSKGVDWLGRNTNFVKGFLAGLAVVAAFVVGVYAPAWWSAAAATLAATWPILAVVAAIALLGTVFGLVYDDIMAFMSGQPSLIGALADKYEWIATIIRRMGVLFRVIGRIAAASFEVIGRVAKAVFGGIASFIRGWYAIAAPIFGFFRDVVVAAFRFISGVVMDRIRPWLPLIRFVMDGMGAAVRAVGGVFSDVFAAIGRWWDALFGRLASGINTILNAARGILGLDVSANQRAAASGVGIGQRQLGNAARSPLASATPGSVSNRRGGDRNVSTGPITINTQATDAQGIAGAFGGALTGELRNAASQFGDGVAR